MRDGGRAPEQGLATFLWNDAYRTIYIILDTSFEVSFLCIILSVQSRCTSSGVGQS
jgi:hypothetical protein